MRNTGPDTSDGFIQVKEIKLAQVSLVIVAGSYTFIDDRKLDR